MQNLYYTDYENWFNDTKVTLHVYQELFKK